MPKIGDQDNAKYANYDNNIISINSIIMAVANQKIKNIIALYCLDV